MRPQWLPPDLGERFSVVAARDAGVTKSTLRSRHLAQPFRGVRRRAIELPDARIERDRLGQRRGPAERAVVAAALDYAVRMGDHEFFSHTTAAVIWGLPLPAPLLDGSVVDVSVFDPHRAPRSRGIRGHQAVAALTSVERHPGTGLFLSSPASTWASLGAVLSHRHDLVAAGDAVVRDWRAEPLATLTQLADAISAGRRVGVGKLRDAHPLIRTRSASRPETRCRLELLDAGLPEPDLNHDVMVGGVYLACVDLAYPGLRVAMEYEGEHHLLDPEQWSRDIVRYERLSAAGWTVVRVTKTELFGNPAAFVRRVVTAMVAHS